MVALLKSSDTDILSGHAEYDVQFYDVRFVHNHMTEAVLTKQRVEDGKTDQLVEWMSEVREREDEVVETFQSEGMVTEAAFLEHNEDDDYLVYFMEAEDLREVYESFGESTHEIDEEHKEIMSDVLEDSEELGVGNYELLYHMVNPDRS